MASENDGLNPTALRKMSKKEFWLRLAAWAAFAVMAPIGFLAWRYGLFTASDGVRVSLNGWGILAVIIIGFFLLYVIKEAKRGMPEGSMLVQCLNGYGLLIPLVLCILILESIKSNIDYLEQVLIVIVVCEAIAIPINPMPRWAVQNNLERGGNFLSTAIKRALRDTISDDNLKK